MTQRLIVLTAALMLVSCAARSDNAYSGTLQKPSAAVGSTLGGRVVRVMVSEGSPVRAGDALLRFDDAQPRSALLAANARLAQARAALADLVAGPRPADLAPARALAGQERAQADIARSTTPYQVDVLRDQLRQALSQVSEARAAAVQAH